MANTDRLRSIIQKGIDLALSYGVTIAPGDWGVKWATQRFRDEPRRFLPVVGATMNPLGATAVSLDVTATTVPRPVDDYKWASFAFVLGQVLGVGEEWVRCFLSGFNGAYPSETEGYKLGAEFRAKYVAPCECR